jgi:hypothetical protein
MIIICIMITLVITRLNRTDGNVLQHKLKHQLHSNYDFSSLYNYFYLMMYETVVHEEVNGIARCIDILEKKN